MTQHLAAKCIMYGIAELTLPKKNPTEKSYNAPIMGYPDRHKVLSTISKFERYHGVTV